MEEPMALFKKKTVKPIEGGTWGHLVSVHKIDVDTLSRDMKCVEREGTLEESIPVTFLRVFKPSEAHERGISVTGWETLDQHPDLIFFEGYLTRTNEAVLERKKG
jgi:hypothetical protein